MKSPKIYYISQGATPDEHLQNIKSMVDAGVDWVQLRIKEVKKKDILEVAQKAQKYCREHQVIFIVNDSPEVAHAIDADGVHLGKEDKSPEMARQLLGKDKIIGGTANTWEDCQKLIQMQVDYIGLGPYRFTTTKKKLSPILGLEGYREIMNKMKENNVKIPIVAIGGITLEDVAEIKKTEVCGIALSGFLHQQTDLKSTIKQLQSFL